MVSITWTCFLLVFGISNQLRQALCKRKVRSNESGLKKPIVFNQHYLRWSLTNSKLETDEKSNQDYVFIGKALSHYHCFQMCLRQVSQEQICGSVSLENEKDCFLPFSRKMFTKMISTKKHCSTHSSRSLFQHHICQHMGRWSQLHRK